MLTDIHVSSAKAKGKPYKLSDGGGLYLHVTANGTRIWRYDYRLEGKRYTVVLGVYPGTSLKVARTRHLAARTAVSEGQHPLSPKQKIKADAAARTKAALHAAQNSFRAVAWKWYNAKAPHRSDSWRDLNRRYLERDLIKAMGDMPIEAVTVDNLREALNAVATASPKNAERVRQVAGQVFQYAIVNNLGPKHNFARDLAGLHEVPRAINNPKLTAPQLPDFFATLEHYAGNVQTRIAIKLLLLTMVRKAELIEANWSEIDFDNALWRIPATRMKMDSSHTVPLSSQALKLFRQMKDLSGKSKWVLPGYSRAKPMSKSTLNVALERMGYRRTLTVHGLRSTAASALQEMGFPSEVINRQLAHTVKGAAGDYLRADFIDARRQMLQHWADYLDATAVGNKILPAGFQKRGDILV
jgi:integrase